ncbi:MAG: hypothetical protein Q7T05_03315, partial [Dehalococcoidia bacterium]|nr:hypothetical protein [Dehalococcoidia bacterium]
MPIAKVGLNMRQPRMLPGPIPAIYPPTIPITSAKCKAMWDFQDGGAKLFDHAGFTPPGALSSDWLTQNQQDLEGGGTAGFVGAGGTVANSTVSPHGGSRCLLVTPNGAGAGEGVNQYWQNSSYFPAAYGQAWTDKVWAKVPTGQTIKLLATERPS